MTDYTDTVLTPEGVAKLRKNWRFEDGKTKEIAERINNPLLKI